MVLGILATLGLYLVHCKWDSDTVGKKKGGGKKQVKWTVIM